MAFRQNRNQGSFRRSGPRRQVGWDISLLSVAQIAVAAGAKVLMLNASPASLATLVPGTIVRTRGMLTIGSDQRSALEDQIGSFGIGLVNSVAGALGVTGVPAPGDEAIWGGWFVHQYFANRFEFVTGAGFETNGQMQFPIDSKAMRKLEGEQALIGVLQNHGSFGFVATLQLRFLIKAG